MAGIYIHIPFCKQACNYCNFHFNVSLANKSKMVAAIAKEISLPQSFINTKEIETIYFGGGTPSLLSNEDLQIIFESIYSTFSISKNAEITLEANPDDINTNKLQLWKKAGVNRLSIGLQSFDTEELKWMNRAHNATQSLQCIDDIQAAGFTNFSVDLIYGSPIQSEEILIHNFNIIAKKNIPHISCYALTVEEGTALYKKIANKKAQSINTATQAQHFGILQNLMQVNGYEQYEISNFCKPNYRSKHNSNYWKTYPYFGFGPSAHAYNGKNIRRWNVANNSLYLKALDNNTIPYQEEILTPTQQLNEYIMTALRTVEGIEVNKVIKVFGNKALENIISIAKKYLADDKIIVGEQNISLTTKGRFFADGIAADMFSLP